MSYPEESAMHGAERAMRDRREGLAGAQEVLSDDLNRLDDSLARLSAALTPVLRTEPESGEVRASLDAVRSSSEITDTTRRFAGRLEAMHGQVERLLRLLDL